MRYFCTYFDLNYLTRGLALHGSLAAQAGSFELVVLCMDKEVESILRQKALPQVRLLPIEELTRHYPALAAAKLDRNKLEFYYTCAAWLMHHVLPSIPAGDLLTYLDADIYFFGSPQPIYYEIGSASIAVTPHRFPHSLEHLERYGKFNAGWVSMRRDPTGMACAFDWAEKCANWCYNRHEPNRYANQRYVDSWHGQFPGTVTIQHPGVNVAPWNIKGGTITADNAAVLINQTPIIFYHFHALTHLGRQLYDPYLDRYDAVLTPGLREHIYRPYLRLLQDGDSNGTGASPDVLPPARADDPRGELLMRHLFARLQESELDRAKRLESVETSRDATEQTVEYLRRVEKDSAERLASIHFYQDKLKTAYADLERNVAYLKILEAEIAAHIKVSADKDEIIGSLAEQVRTLTHGKTVSQ